MTAGQSLQYILADLIEIPSGYTVKMVAPIWGGAGAGKVVGRYNGTAVTFTNITSTDATGISGSASVLLEKS